MTHVLSGQLNKQIAADLVIDERSVKRHRTSLMRKLEVQSVAELGSTRRRSGNRQVTQPGLPPVPKGTLPARVQSSLSAHWIQMSSSTNIFVAVVDDDESLCRSLGRLLRVSGIQPVTYSSAEAFFADDKRPRFDCLVLTSSWAGMSGIELNQRLAAAGSTTPVIFNTAHDEPEIREQAIQSGCAAYLRKTQAGEEALAAITQAIRSGPGKSKHT